mmetsp:Transcript_20199/g.52530  ORF Transcript_20199/g.52530 Transcript_20199/m.52530 type:complete len:263 (+) Transcript_20199:108-896(+)
MTTPIAEVPGGWGVQSGCVAAYCSNISVVRCSMISRYCSMFDSVTPWLPSISSTAADVPPNLENIEWMPVFNCPMVLDAAWCFRSYASAASVVFSSFSSSSLSTRFRCVSVLTPWPLNFSVSSLVSAIANSVASMSLFNSLIELNNEKFFCSMSWNVSTSSSTVCIPVALVILSKVAWYSWTSSSVSFGLSSSDFFFLPGDSSSSSSDSSGSSDMYGSSSAFLEAANASAVLRSCSSRSFLRRASCNWRSCSMSAPRSAHSF